MTPTSKLHKVYVPPHIWAYVSSSLVIPFPTPLLASQGLEILSPDKELKEDFVTRELYVEGTDLRAEFECVSARMARISVNAFLEGVDLVLSSMGELGNLV
jgi:EKC/KEOPS complex subunit PCC1/LAGE3